MFAKVRIKRPNKSFLKNIEILKERKSICFGYQFIEVKSNFISLEMTKYCSSQAQHAFCLAD